MLGGRLTPSGAPILNLGCGTRTSPYCVNIDWNAHLRLRTSRIGSALAPVIMGRGRLSQFRALDGMILVHDLRRGIPAADDSVAAVYHSHVLEHIDRELVPRFLAEIWRVLRPGGIHRIVVPDLEVLCRDYLSHLDECAAGTKPSGAHDAYVAALLEQSVRKQAAGSARQPKHRRLIENALLGDARRRGETHQWMYDRVNLTHVLYEANFDDVRVATYDTSVIDGWNTIRLDETEDGNEYKPGSLYLEAIK